MSAYSVAIAEDNKLALKAILEKLSPFQDITVKAIAANGQEICDKLTHELVDIVLMDIEMPFMNGIEATQRISKIQPQAKIIMLTTFDDDDKIFNAILAGASGYLLKDEPASMIHQSIINSMKGGAAMSPGIALKALRYIKNDLSARQQPPEENILTERETGILTLLKDGLPYKQIADKLFISEGTVRKHIENIYRKLQVNNKVSAVNIATEKKWV